MCILEFVTWKGRGKNSSDDHETRFLSTPLDQKSYGTYPDPLQKRAESKIDSKLLRCFTLRYCITCFLLHLKVFNYIVLRVANSYPLFVQRFVIQFIRPLESNWGGRGKTRYQDFRLGESDTV